MTTLLPPHARHCAFKGHSQLHLFFFYKLINQFFSSYSKASMSLLTFLKSGFRGDAFTAFVCVRVRGTHAYSTAPRSLCWEERRMEKQQGQPAVSHPLTLSLHTETDWSTGSSAAPLSASLGGAKWNRRVQLTGNESTSVSSCLHFKKRHLSFCYISRFFTVRLHKVSQ